MTSPQTRLRVVTPERLDALVSSLVNTSGTATATAVATKAGTSQGGSTTGVTTATASTVMGRDASGRSQVANPSVSADIANLGWVSANYVPNTAKGTASGVATLDGSSFLSSAQVPQYLTRSLGSVTSFPSSPRIGDVCVRSDIGTGGSLWTYSGIGGSGGWSTDNVVTCTSTTLPGVVYAGLMAYCTDSKQLLTYTGTVWIGGTGLPIAAMRQTSSQTNLPPSWNVLSMNQADIDTHGGWSGANPSRWTVPANQGGVYSFEGTVTGSNLAAGNNFNGGFKINGNFMPIAWGNSSWTNTNGQFMGVTTGRKITTLSVGDYVELCGYYNASVWSTYFDAVIGTNWTIERLR